MLLIFVRTALHKGYIKFASRNFLNISLMDRKKNSQNFLNRSSYQRCSVNKVFLEISQNSQENACTRVSFLCNFIKNETLAQVFPCEFLKTTFHNEHIWWLPLSKAGCIPTGTSLLYHAKYWILEFL